MNLLDRKKIDNRTFSTRTGKKFHAVARSLPVEYSYWRNNGNVDLVLMSYCGNYYVRITPPRITYYKYSAPVLRDGPPPTCKNCLKQWEERRKAPE